MTASKGRFATITVSSLLTCLILGLTATSVGLPAAIASKISEILGFGPIESGAPSVAVILMTTSAMILIYRFGSKAMVSWEAPQRVSEINLAEKDQENSIFAVALEQLKIFLSGKSDPLASDAVQNWKKKVIEPPKLIETKDLIRDLIISAFREIQIPENGWRDEGQLWVGEILGIEISKTKQVIVFVFDTYPTENDIALRYRTVSQSVNDLSNFQIYAVYLSKEYGEELINNIDIDNHRMIVMSSRYLITKSLDLRNYALELLRVFENTKVGGTKATLRTSYVELFIDKKDSLEEPMPLLDAIHSWIKSDNNHHIAITGEFGQGKSTALLKYCCDWAKHFLSTNSLSGKVPLLIELRGKSPSETDPLSLIAEWSTRYRLIPQQVMNLIKSGDAIVIFEGFDELRNAGRAFYRHQHFNALWRFAYPKTKLIFTGRPNFFLDQEESNRTLRTEAFRAATGGAYTEVWRLLKMDKSQISNACRSYDSNVSYGIISAIEKNKDFLEIVSRPSMLPVVATIWNDISELQASGTKLTGAILIELYIQAIFARKEAELESDKIILDAPSLSRYLQLPKQVREMLTLCVAWRMSGLKLKNTIPRSEITEMVKDIYEDLFVIAKSRGVSPAVSEGMIEFEKRNQDESLSDRVEAITSEICSSGLLIPDPVGGASNLRFPHKQFYEFLLAKCIFIIRCNSMPNAIKILSGSSSEKLALSRLAVEPNCLGYLAECAGPDLSVIFSRTQRVFMQITVINMLIW